MGGRKAILRPLPATAQHLVPVPVAYIDRMFIGSLIGYRSDSTIRPTDRGWKSTG
jgi:hypothetical protein